MDFEYKTKGVCSQRIFFTIDADRKVSNVKFIGGCDGNLSGICSLLRGVKAEDAIARMEGIHCGPRATSCPDQIAQALKAALIQLHA